MVYMGSKAKYAKYIVPILQKTIDENNVDTYIECFVGGANIIDKINCASCTEDSNKACGSLCQTGKSQKRGRFSLTNSQKCDKIFLYSKTVKGSKIADQRREPSDGARRRVKRWITPPGVAAPKAMPSRRGRVLPLQRDPVV